MFEGRRIKALGAMSGTSLDGVDAAMIETDGQQIFGFGPSVLRAYSPDEQAILRAHLGLWQGDDVAAAIEVVEAAHVAALGGFPDVELIGFHGQTLAHDPVSRRTHQCGNGARLAAALSRPVAWDFRTADVAAGGQGAPLAPFFHFALAKWIGATEPLAFLNLGGVGNITFVDPHFSDPVAPGAVFAFDTGPANAPMNDVMLIREGQPYDKDGEVAARGTANDAIIRQFSSDPYFAAPPPKSLDRDAFDALSASVKSLKTTDALATLAAAAVASVAHGFAHLTQIPSRILVTGGGRKNAALMNGLREALPCDVHTVEDVGLDGDMLEAQAFAYLAVRVAYGLPLSAPGTTGAPVPVIGGQISGDFKIMP